MHPHAVHWWDQHEIHISRTILLQLWCVAHFDKNYPHQFFWHDKYHRQSPWHQWVTHFKIQSWTAFKTKSQPSTSGLQLSLKSWYIVPCIGGWQQLMAVKSRITRWPNVSLIRSYHHSLVLLFIIIISTRNVELNNKIWCILCVKLKLKWVRALRNYRSIKVFKLLDITTERRIAFCAFH